MANLKRLKIMRQRKNKVPEEVLIEWTPLSQDN